MSMTIHKSQTDKKMTTPTPNLQALMNEMASRPVPIKAHDHQKAPASEEMAYVALDPVYADLHKQYRDAKARHRKLIQIYKSQDPLLEVAADMLESLESACETRLIELRRDLIMRAAVRRLLREQQLRIEEENHAHSTLYRMRMIAFHNENYLSIKKRTKQEQQDSINFFMLCHVMLNNALLRAQNAFSLAQDFSMATTARKLNESAA